MVDDIEDALKRFEAVHLNRGPEEPGFSELAQMKNENYHLKLALDEKNLELESLRKTVQSSIFIEDVHKLQGETLFVAGPPPSSSGTDLEVVTHFSGSPYKGRRTNSKATEHSVATTTASNVKAEHEFFEQSVLPFMEKMIGILKLSTIFKTEGHDLERKYDRFEAKLRGSHFDADSVRKILDEILYYHRQTAAILNRELKFKELSQRLEYLFSIFLDPREYDMDPQEHIEYLREEITDTLIRIFHYQNMPPEKELLECDERIEARIPHFRRRSGCSPLLYVNKRANAQRLKSIEQGFEICAHAMNQAFGDKQELRMQEDDSIPSVVSSEEAASEVSENGQREKDRLKESKSSLEFIPIGYDENLLSSKTPQRKIYKKQPLNEITPKANDENDPLQMFFQEQASYYDNTIDRRPRK